jgi:hypothetical protein
MSALLLEPPAREKPTWRDKRERFLRMRPETSVLTVDLDAIAECYTLGPLMESSAVSAMMRPTALPALADVVGRWTRSTTRSQVPGLLPHSHTSLRG